jgi:hypothetical protein
VIAFHGTLLIAYKEEQAELTLALHLGLANKGIVVSPNYSRLSKISFFYKESEKLTCALLL